jgi:predicted nucleotidyltransferase
VTSVRSIPPDFDPAIVSAIDQRLERIAAEQNVAVLWAVESGSRAWGFPSPDSDYDCRFIFVRPVEDYLTVSPRRDVIEVPTEEGLDICGWDLFKMAKLLLKGNAAVSNG